MFMKSSFEELSDSQWESIKEYFPLQRRRKYDLRDIVDAILFLLRTGGQWRDLRLNGLPVRSVYYYFRKWKRDGTLLRLNGMLNCKERERQGRKPTPSMVCIDIQSVKAAPFTDRDRGLDGNKHVNGRKRHVPVDNLGLVWAVVVHAANIHDGTRPICWWSTS